MEVNKIIQTMGSIAKVEKLATLENNILANTLVLEETEPFPGYHGANLPSGYNPTAIYLIIKKKLSNIKIRRITQEIKKYFKHEFDGTAATICINNDVYSAIRLRYFKDIKVIPELQKDYMYEGVKFEKKKAVRGDGIIELNKHFELEALGEGIYKDLEDPFMFYLRIPKHMSWQMFMEITTSIKHNLDNLNFDGALGSIYLKDIIDVVRIFAKDMELKDLTEIRQQYLNELRKY
jgi:hypothetical protein